MEANASDRANAATGKLVATLSTALATVIGGGWFYIGRIDQSRITTGETHDRERTEIELRERRQAKRMRKLRAIEERLLRQDALLLEIAGLLSGHVSNPKRKLNKPLSLIRAEQRLRED